MHTNSQRLKVALAQISPVWFQREKTLNKVIDYVKQAAAENCHLVTFGEALVPGYPFWIELTNGSKFNCEQTKKHSSRIRGASGANRTRRFSSTLLSCG